jgi:mannose-6-phosphate isomerase-like protein (cupin superfamily)
LRPAGNGAKNAAMKPLPLLALLVLGVAARAASLEAPPTDVIMFDHAKVDDSFAKGLPLLLNTSYKISAGRRVMPGTVEFHERDTDIIYVTEGTATFITGGTMVEPKTTSPNEIHATAITGGVTHHLTKGDMIVIPAGTPHWFKEVPGTFLYLLIKVTK